MVATMSWASLSLDALYTWEALWDETDDPYQYEVIDGELYIMAPPIPLHQEVLLRAVRAFDDVASATNAGRVYFSPIGVKLSERDAVEPDLIFIARDRISIIKEKYIDGPPDIVLEILSPSTRAKDRTEKADLYARSGVLEYWQIDPRHRSVVVLALVDGAYVPVQSPDGIARSDVLPGVAIPIAGLFEDLT